MPEEPTNPQAPPLTADTFYKAKLLEVLYQNPKLRPKLLELVKEYNPDVAIPDVDVPRLVSSAVEERTKELVQLKVELEADRKAEATRRQREALTTAHRLVEEDWAEIDKLATERALDLETAAELHKARQRVATPRSMPFQPAVLPDVKELYRNPTQWARAEAHRVLQELGRG